MNDNNKPVLSIKGLFIESQSITIPAYQRAYSWEIKQCEQFLDDLKEQEGKQYYLGQFLFESEGEKLYVIDGQQRLTTTLLFFAAFHKVSANKGIDVQELQEIYLNDTFRTIEDDQILFKRILTKQVVAGTVDGETISQKKLITSFSYFFEELSKLNDVELTTIRQTLEDAIITTFHISSKIEATQVFEYQNNRGKELSRFEIIKAYLMHQVYVHSENMEQANVTIREIERTISVLYRYFEAVDGFFSEADLLDSYCNLYYSTNGSLNELKDLLEKEDEKVRWIHLFFEDFAGLALSAKNIVRQKHEPSIARLFFLGNEADWKLILLTIYSRGDNTGEYFEKILKLLEILCFKLKLGDFRSDHLPRYAKKYFDSSNDYGILNLYEEIKEATIQGFKWYWNSDGRFQNLITDYFDNQKWHYSSTIKYLLWQYENALRYERKSGVLLDKELYESYTIEHICPQNPKDSKHSEDFKKNYLQIAGNLALLTQSQNSKFGNKSFDKKRALFQDTALTSYSEIREKGQWTEIEITERHQKITEFAKIYFDTSGL